MILVLKNDKFIDYYSVIRTQYDSYHIVKQFQNCDKLFKYQYYCSNIVRQFYANFWIGRTENETQISHTYVKRCIIHFMALYIIGRWRVQAV